MALAIQLDSTRDRIDRKMKRVTKSVGADIDGSNLVRKSLSRFEEMTPKFEDFAYSRLDHVEPGHRHW